MGVRRAQRNKNTHKNSLGHKHIGLNSDHPTTLAIYSHLNSCTCRVSTVSPVPLLGSQSQFVQVMSPDLKSFPYPTHLFSDIIIVLYMYAMFSQLSNILVSMEHPLAPTRLIGHKFTAPYHCYCMCVCVKQSRPKFTAASTCV